MKYYDEKKTHQDKKLDKNIKSYLEALSIFTKIDKISENFSKIYDERNKNNILTENFDSLESFIKYFKQNNIKEKKNFSKTPENIFNLFLDELHKLFKMNSLKEEEEEKEIGKNKEIDFDKDIAHQSFNKFYKKDRSIIRDLFFGVKLIKKTCKFCGITEYNYKYLKVVPLNVEQITSEIEAEAEAEDIISSLEKSFEKEFLCQICSIKQKFDIEMKVIKEPKILIIIIKNCEKEIKIKNCIKVHKKKYNLISAFIISNPGILDYIFKCGKKQSKILFDESSNIFKEKIPEGIPYILFYKIIEDDQNENDYSRDNDLNSGRSITTDHNKTKNQYNINSDRFKFTNLEGENNFNSNQIFMDKKEICLYFTFENHKQLYLDIDNCETFYNIIGQLIQKYNLSENDINEQKIYFKGKNIDCQKCPRELGMKDGTDIQVY